MLDVWNMSGDLLEGYMTGENRSKGKGKVHPIIGHEGPEVENGSGQRKKKPSQCHKSKKDWGLGTNPRVTRVNRNRSTYTQTRSLPIMNHYVKLILCVQWGVIM